MVGRHGVWQWDWGDPREEDGWSGWSGEGQAGRHLSSEVFAHCSTSVLGKWDVVRGGERFFFRQFTKTKSPPPPPTPPPEPYLCTAWD